MQSLAKWRPANELHPIEKLLSNVIKSHKDYLHSVYLLPKDDINLEGIHTEVSLNSVGLNCTNDPECSYTMWHCVTIGKANRGEF